MNRLRLLSLFFALAGCIIVTIFRYQVLGYVSPLVVGKEAEGIVGIIMPSSHIEFLGIDGSPSSRVCRKCFKVIYHTRRSLSEIIRFVRPADHRSGVWGKGLRTRSIRDFPKEFVKAGNGSGRGQKLSLSYRQLWKLLHAQHLSLEFELIPGDTLCLAVGDYDADEINLDITRINDPGATQHGGDYMIEAGYIVGYGRDALGDPVDISKSLARKYYMALAAPYLLILLVVYVLYKICSLLRGVRSGRSDGKLDAGDSI